MLRCRGASLFKALAILCSALLVFWQDLEVVANDAFNSEVMNYVLVIPFFMAYALYRKRRMLQAVAPLENPKAIREAETIAGAFLLLTAFVLYWQGSYTFYPVEYHLVSMPVFLAGAVLLVYNWQTLRQLLFPLAMLLLLEPFPLEVANMVGFQLSVLSSTAAYGLLKSFNLPVTLDTSQTPIITVQTVQGAQVPLAVDVACSGLYSLTGFVVFAAFAAFVMRGAAWKRAALFSAGFPAIYGLNVLRIAGIVWIARGWGEGAAMQAFHLMGGSVLIFVATLLLLTLGDRVGKLRIFSSGPKQEPCALCNESLVRGESFCPYCGKFLGHRKLKATWQGAARAFGVVAIALLVIPIQMPPFALAKGTASVDLGDFSAAELKNQLLPNLPGWDLEFLYRDRDVEYWAKWDAALVYYYRKRGPEELQPIVFVLIQVEKGRHTWEASLYQWPAQHGYPTATMLVERDVNVMDNPQIAGRFLVFKRLGSTVTEAVVYWFEKALFTLNGTAVSRYVSISLDAYPGALASAGAISGPDDFDGAQAMLLPMARAIAEHWEPLKTWTLVNFSLGQWAGYALALTTAPCAAAAALLFLRTREERRGKARLFQRLDEEDKELLAAMAPTPKDLQTGMSIEAIHYTNTGRETEPRKLVEKLEEAEKVGLVARKVVGMEDEPYLVWKRDF
ncbi:MAG: exosortase/archaeosortase family protein [Candidatus Brockarchaeota archaeon]|nr:exosortase/archaeosortase family protein [Candidatus Brockarchaeota archaeon]